MKATVLVAIEVTCIASPTLARTAAPSLFRAEVTATGIVSTAAGCTLLRSAP
jgi:hypothetical protein